MSENEAEVVNKQISMQEAQALILAIDAKSKSFEIEPFMFLPMFTDGALEEANSFQAENRALFALFNDCLAISTSLKKLVRTHELESGLSDLIFSYEASAHWVGFAGKFLQKIEGGDEITSVPVITDISEALNIKLKFASLSKEEISGLGQRYEIESAELPKKKAAIEAILGQKLLRISQNDLDAIQRFTSI